MTRFATLLAAVLLSAACAGPAPTRSPSPTPAASPSTSTSPSSSPATATASPEPTPGPKGEVTLMTHDAFALSSDVIAAFQQQSGYTLKVLPSGDAGTMVNQAILSRDHPLGDLLFGVDNTFLSRALDKDLFTPYTAADLDTVPEAFQLDAKHRVTPIDYGDVCLNIDRRAFGGPSQPPVPTTLSDLTQPEYKDLLVVENPALSSPGLAFMLATIARFKEDGNPSWLDYWAALRQNGVKVSPSWDDAYYTQFSGSSGQGPRPIVVSYASSPPAEVYFADPPISEPPTAAILDGCFRQVEFAGVLAGAKNPDGAKAFIDFLLTPRAQQDVPLQMFVFPAVTGTQLPGVFQQFAKVPDQPLRVDPKTIEQNRERWLDEWNKTVLR